MNSIKIYFIIRGSNINEQIAEVAKAEPHVTLKMNQDTLPQLGKISIKMFDIKFYPIEEGKPIPLSEEKVSTFDVARQWKDQQSGDLYIFAYAKYEGES